MTLRQNSDKGEAEISVRTVPATKASVNTARESHLQTSDAFYTICLLQVEKTGVEDAIRVFIFPPLALPCSHPVRAAAMLTWPAWLRMRRDDNGHHIISPFLGTQKEGGRIEWRTPLLLGPTSKGGGGGGWAHFPTLTRDA